MIKSGSYSTTQHESITSFCKSSFVFQILYFRFGIQYGFFTSESPRDMSPDLIFGVITKLVMYPRDMH